MKCDICVREAKPHSIDCPRCYRHVNASGYHRHARRVGLKGRYFSDVDLFRCIFTDVAMSDDDLMSPYHVTSSCKIPKDYSVLIPNCAFTAVMKSELSDEELLAVVPHLDDHLRKGTPFRRDIVPFAYWNRRPRPKTASPLFAGLPQAVPGRTCSICIRPPYGMSPYCERCRRIIRAKKSNIDTAAGLKKHYDPAADGFRCIFSGEVLDTDDIYSPWYLVMDHLVPGQRKVAPSAAWANGMKGRMTYAVFLKALGEFANHIRTGEPFDTSVITRDEWKRNLMYMRLAGRRIA